MLYRALEHQAKKHPRKLAVIGERRSLTFKQLWQEATELALHLRKAGLKRGDAIAVGIPPSPDFYVLFYGAAALGIVTLPVSPFGKLSPQLKKLDRLCLAGDAQFLASAVKHDCPQKILWDREQGFGVPRTSASLRPRRILRKENALGMSSSGSTGEPVVFIRSAEAAYERARLGGRAWSIEPRDTLLSTGPFTSGVNALYHLVLPIIQGSTVVVIEKFERRKLVEMISRHKVTVLFAVPMTFDILARLPSDYPVDLSSLRRCISGGSHLSPAIAAAFHQRFRMHVAQGYGGSHFAPAFTASPNGVPGAVGHRDGIFPVRIVTVTGKVTAPGKIGEIVFDVSAIKNSWAKALLKKNLHRRGRYIYTGDLGRFDEHGHLFVVGRKGTIIKVGGNRVNPAEVEEIIRAHPRVRDVIVFPLRAGATDETVGAIVVRNGRVSAEELIHYCAQELEPHKCPRSITFRKSLLHNAHGKIIRYLYSHSPARNLKPAV